MVEAKKNERGIILMIGVHTVRSGVQHYLSGVFPPVFQESSVGFRVEYFENYTFDKNQDNIIIIFYNGSVNFWNPVFGKSRIETHRYLRHCLKQRY